MEKIRKSVQELAAQTRDTYPFFNNFSLPDGEAGRLSNQASDYRNEVEDALSSQTTDEEPARESLVDIWNQAQEDGVWRADEGIGADARLAHVAEQRKSYGYSDDEALSLAKKELGHNGYLDAIRSDRRERERLFKQPTTDYINKHEIDVDSEKHEMNTLMKRMIDLTTSTKSEHERLLHAFPSGNFLYHGTNTEQLTEIFDTGVLANAKALQRRENEAADTSGRESKAVRRNSGYEGVSWSMNEIDALPGDRYHLAGFVAPPEATLSNEQQLAVPSRPAPNEVIQLSGKIDADDYYTAKTQLELYCSPSVFGETNSVFGNLVSASMGKNENDRQSDSEPSLYRAIRDLGPDYRSELRRLYSTDMHGKIRLDPDLLQSADPKIPVAAVWLQAAIDGGRLKDTRFANMDLPAVVNQLDSDNVGELLDISRQDYEQDEAVLDEAEKHTSDVEVPVENMYFVCPRKDAESWLRVVARSPHKPAGILLYDDKKIRLENFASVHHGDQAELTSELQSVISPDNDDYIDYSQVLGTKTDETMRSGSAGQVIAERYLGARKSIKSRDGTLVIE